MKHINLPQEARTNKVETLPDDLKSIAEEMLAKKFGVEEEVVREEPPFDPFLRIHESHTATDDGFLQASTTTTEYDYRGRRGFLNDIQISIQPWDRRKIAQVNVNAPSERHIRDAIDNFEWSAVPRYGRQWVFNPRFWNYLKSDPRMGMSTSHKPTPREWREGVEVSVAYLYGIPVTVSPHIREGLLIARF